MPYSESTANGFTTQIDVKRPKRHSLHKVIPCGSTPSPSPGPSPAPTIPYTPVAVGQRCLEGVLYPIYEGRRKRAARMMQGIDVSQQCYDLCLEVGYSPVRELCLPSCLDTITACSVLNFFLICPGVPL